MFAAHCSHTTTIQSFFSSVVFFCLLCKGLPLSFSHCPNHLYLNHRQKSLSSQFPHHPSDYGEDVRGVAEPTCKALLNINGSCIPIILNLLIRNPKFSREKSKQNQEQIQPTQKGLLSINRSSITIIFTVCHQFRSLANCRTCPILLQFNCKM